MATIGKLFRHAGLHLILLLAAAAVCTLCMIAVYMLPTNRIFRHVKENRDIFQDNYTASWASEIPSAALSFGTDAIMLNQAIYAGRDKPVYNAMMNPRYDTGDGNVMMSLNMVLDYEKLSDIKPVGTAVTPHDSFRDQNKTDHFDELETMYYPRYWHGYLAVQKPLLLFLNVAEIKLLSMYVQVILFAIVLLLMVRSCGAGVGFSFICTLFAINPVTAVLTFQETDVMVLTLLACLLVLLLRHKLEERKLFSYFFLLVGAATCFFDFLTYPLVTLGVPLVLIITTDKEPDLRKNLKTILGNSVAWGFGYAGMWFGKFLICSLLTGYDAIGGGLKSFFFRVNGDSAGGNQIDVGFIKVVGMQLRCLINGPNTVIAAGVLLFIIVVLLRGYRNRISLSACMSLLLIGLMPFGWFLVTANHAAIHYYMTYREFAISIFALGSVLLYRWRKAENDKAFFGGEGLL